MNDQIVKLTCEMNTNNSMMINALALFIGHLASKPWLYFVKLFTPRGAYAEFWCVFWRLLNDEVREIANMVDRIGLKSILNSSVHPYRLAYYGKGD